VPAEWLHPPIKGAMKTCALDDYDAPCGCTSDAWEGQWEEPPTVCPIPQTSAQRHSHIMTAIFATITPIIYLTLTLIFVMLEDYSLGHPSPI